MNVLVTGARGFIGSHLMEYLDGRVDAAAFDGDVADVESWTPYRFVRWDAIVHLAGKVGTADSMANPVEYVRSNVLGTATLVQAMHGHVGRVVLASSSACYAPRSVYATTKLAQEDLLRLSGIPTVALRIHACYGPGQYGGVGGVVGMLAQQIVETGRATVYQGGTSKRDFVYVTDVVRAIDAALEEKPATSFVSQDVGTGIATPVGSVARRLSDRFGAENPEIVQHGRPGDGVDAVAIPGLDEYVPLVEGLDRYVDWLRPWFRRAYGHD